MVKYIMTKFEELLSKPLPSAANAVVECGDTVIEDDIVVAPATSPVEPEVVPPVVTPVVTPEVEPIVADDTEVDDLTPEESQRVDDVMNAVATPLLIKTEMTEEEIEEFVESADCDIAEAEGFLTERTIIKFDKNAKKAQLYEVAVAACARERGDKLYKKLETVYKMERILKAKLRKKYNAPAQKKVKEYLARAKKSKSGILAKIANKIMGK